MAIRTFSLTRVWPMKSARRFGRTLASRRASSSYARPETTRWGGCVMSVPRSAVRALLQGAAQGLQRRAQQRLEVRLGAIAAGIFDRGLGQALVVAEVGQGGDHIGIELRSSGLGDGAKIGRAHV